MRRNWWLKIAGASELERQWRRSEGIETEICDLKSTVLQWNLCWGNQYGRDDRDGPGCPKKEIPYFGSKLFFFIIIFSILIFINN